MALSNILTPHITKAIDALFGVSVENIELQATRRDFEGDITMVIFPLLKVIKSNPVELGNKIGQYLVDNTVEVERFNVVSGFLNLVISNDYYINFFNGIRADEDFGTVKPTEGGKAVMVEYASPNTNKPLHLGHVRNVLLGYSVAKIIEASGQKVYKTQVINDRGIHICKSMLAYEKFGKGETPESAGVKGDKLVGNYYVEFDKKYKSQLQEIAKEQFKSYASKIYTRGENNGIIINTEINKQEQPLLYIFYETYEKALRDYIHKSLGIEYSYLEKHVLLSSDFFIQQDDELSEKIAVKKKEFQTFLEVNSLLVENSNAGRDTENLILNEIVEEANKSILDKIENSQEIISQVELLQQAQEMLRKWEAGDEQVVALWEKMNGWVYDGFDASFKAIGVDFDKNYYESDTYLLGKDVVADGLAKGVFYKKEDGSVWIDLTDEGLDEKLVLRKDGTSVYITQDIGTAIQRVKDFPDVGGMVYTVGNEQDYHFKVLFLILKKLGFEWAANLYHLSYGMVDLPSGKMKSREGTVVDADDLMAEMTQTAQEISEELGKLEGYSDEDKARLYNIIGLGALKYYILKVDPKKRILFDPKESVDFAGNTGPFIQYTYARIQSLLRKADFDFGITLNAADITLHEKEKELLKQVAQYPAVIQSAAESHSPALIANYTYELVKEYNSFYQSVPVLGAEVANEKIFRVQLSKKVGETIKSAFGLLGIGVPERM